MDGQASQGGVPTNHHHSAAPHSAVTQSDARNTQYGPVQPAHVPASAPSASAAERLEEADSSHGGQSSQTTSSKTTAADQRPEGQEQEQEQGHVPPALPAPAESATGATAPVQLEVNGPAVSLADQLGPAVIHADGTISRIGNWACLTEAERRNTLRVLGKRNKIRLEALRDGSAQDE